MTPAAVAPHIWALAMVSIALSAAAQMLMKVGMAMVRAGGRIDSASADAVLAVLFNPWVFGGLACYAASACLWLVVLSQMPLSMAYPLMGAGIVVVVIGSALLLGEPVGLLRAAGVALVVAGVSLVGAGR